MGSVSINYLVRPDHPLLRGEVTDGSYPILLSSRARGTLPDALVPVALGRPHIIEDSSTLVALTAQTDAIWISTEFTAPEEIDRGNMAILWPDGRSGHDPRIIFYTLERRSLSPAARAMKRAMTRELKNFERSRRNGLVRTDPTSI